MKWFELNLLSPVGDIIVKSIKRASSKQVSRKRFRSSASGTAEGSVAQSRD